MVSLWSIKYVEVCLFSMFTGNEKEMMELLNVLAKVQLYNCFEEWKTQIQ